MRAYVWHDMGGPCPCAGGVDSMEDFLMPCTTRLHGHNDSRSVLANESEEGNTGKQRNNRTLAQPVSGRPGRRDMRDSSMGEAGRGRLGFPALGHAKRQAIIRRVVRAEGLAHAAPRSVLPHVWARCQPKHARQPCSATAGSPLSALPGALVDSASRRRLLWALSALLAL